MVGLGSRAHTMLRHVQLAYAHCHAVKAKYCAPPIRLPAMLIDSISWLGAAQAPCTTRLGLPGLGHDDATSNRGLHFQERHCATRLANA